MKNHKVKCYKCGGDTHLWYGTSLDKYQIYICLNYSCDWVINKKDHDRKMLNDALEEALEEV